MTKTHIIIHHSLTPDGKTVDWNAIWNYHTKTLGWSSIGYHWGLEDIAGRLQVLRGRPTDCDGAHSLEFNKNGIGICCVGNFDVQVPTMELYNLLSDFCKWLMGLYGIPKENVLGHGEGQKMLGVKDFKTCPGKMFNMDQLRRML